MLWQTQRLRRSLKCWPSSNEKPRGAAAATNGSKSIADFERELQTISNADRAEWLRKNKAAIKNARVTDVVPNAYILKKESR
jgi:hypothetical protein